MKLLKFSTLVISALFLVSYSAKGPRNYGKGTKPAPEFRVSPNTTRADLKVKALNFNSTLSQLESLDLDFKQLKPDQYSYYKSLAASLGVKLGISTATQMVVDGIKNPLVTLICAEAAKFIINGDYTLGGVVSSASSLVHDFAINSALHIGISTSSSFASPKYSSNFSSHLARVAMSLALSALPAVFLEDPSLAIASSQGVAMHQATELFNIIYNKYKGLFLKADKDSTQVSTHNTNLDIALPQDIIDEIKRQRGEDLKSVKPKLEERPIQERSRFGRWAEATKSLFATATAAGLDRYTNGGLFLRGIRDAALYNVAGIFVNEHIA